mgnify:CR=1 FL=1
MQSSRLAFAAVLVLFTLVGASLTSFATDHPAAGTIVSAEKEGADSVLTDRVETLLRSDIGLVGSRLRVQSRDGVVTVRGGDFQGAFAAIAAERTQAVFVGAYSTFVTDRQLIIDLARRQKLPTMWEWAEQVRDGVIEGGSDPRREGAALGD